MFRAICGSNPLGFFEVEPPDQEWDENSEKIGDGSDNRGLNVYFVHQNDQRSYGDANIGKQFDQQKLFGDFTATWIAAPYDTSYEKGVSSKNAISPDV